MLLRFLFTVVTLLWLGESSVPTTPAGYCCNGPYSCQSSCHQRLWGRNMLVQFHFGIVTLLCLGERSVPTAPAGYLSV